MEKSPRLLVITELYLPTKGGTAVWFDEVYRRLGGKDIHIVAADVSGAADHDAHHPNSVNRVALRRHWWLRPESLAMYAKLFATSLRLALRHRFEAIHAGRVLPEGFVGWVVAEMVRRPLVVYAHGEEITTWRKGAKFKAMCFVYRRADRIIANSDFTRDELLKLGVAAQRIMLISPGVDVQRFQPGLSGADLRRRLGIDAAQPLIFSVGRLSRRKGFDQVIHALPALVKQGIDVHYALGGIGPDSEYLKTLAEKLHVGERVHSLGAVSMEELPHWYNTADVFAMPNREINGDTEGFGMVFLEAAACGKPVVAGSAGGTGAAVEHQMTGLRIDGTQLEQVQDALAQLLQDKEYAQRLGEQGLQRTLASYSWESVAAKTKILHEQLLAESCSG